MGDGRNVDIHFIETPVPISQEKFMAKSTLSLTFTRYLWVWLAGAALGAGAGAGCFGWAFYHIPQYTARIPFQVTPPVTPIFDDTRIIVPPGDDTAQFLRRQRLLFQQDSFLQRLLTTEEFHPADNQTPWLTAHRQDPVKALKDDLVVVLHPDAAEMEITFTSRNATEAQRLVQAAAREYLELMRDQSLLQHNAEVRGISEVVKKVESDVRLMRDALADFGRQKQIDVLKAGYLIKVEALKGLNEDFIKADAEANSAEAQFDTLKKRREALRTSNMTASGMSATPATGVSDLEIANVLLSPEMKRSIENDDTLRTLIKTRLQWEQELAAEQGKNGPTSSRLAEITARLREINDQIIQTRNKLTLGTLESLEMILRDEAVRKRSLASYVGEIRKRKEDETNNLGQQMLQWDQKVADVKEAQDTLNRMRAQLRLAQANQFIDDTRVHSIIDIAATAVPTNPSWPEWSPFVETGAAAGLVVGGLLALGLAQARSRRLRSPYPPALPTNERPTA
jgi:uncharacterized protein involved in exopolysaccharide biosynthesis